MTKTELMTQFMMKYVAFNNFTCKFGELNKNNRKLNKF